MLHVHNYSSMMIAVWSIFETEVRLATRKRKTLQAINAILKRMTKDHENDSSKICSAYLVLLTFP